MVKVKSSKGGMVQVTIIGVVDVINNLMRNKIILTNPLDVELARQAQFIASEVQESIIGNRDETRSVATGLLANSIIVNKIEKGVFKVFPRKDNYPNSNTTTDEVAFFMEFGTRGKPPRHHFTNTRMRNERKVVDNINAFLKRNIK